MITLITGGSRSGKSAFAQQLVEQDQLPRLFIATCPRLDPEMDERISKHCRDRAGRGWQTTEEPLLVAEQLGSALPGTSILVDCLTLWISNLMHEAKQRGNSSLDEEQMIVLANELSQAARKHQGRVVIVTNEVGLGIVPASASARRFRDLAGRCNQIVAAAADEVFLVCCGIPLRLK
jgi:adenosylcobinamide kinase/adenosylcobinamide-phosphate guanylyltransferase